ncbi:MAG: DMT family transporter [Candidatus Acidiferrales bacterium]
MGPALGLAAAVLWGLADFVARSIARRIGAMRTTIYLQMVGFLLICIFFEVQGGFHRVFAAVGGGWHPWAWGALAGVLNGFAAVCFYSSLTKGKLSIVTPIAASYPALTLVLSMFSGEAVRWENTLGIVVSLAGVVFAATTFDSADDVGNSSAGPAAAHAQHTHVTSGVGWASGAACGFGVMFWLIGYHVMPVLGGVASVWIIRLSTLVSLTLVAIPARQSIAFPRGSVWWLIPIMAGCDTAAFLCNNFGLAHGPVSVVTMLASLFSAVTVLLAGIFLRERLERTQWLGIALIFAGIILMNI